MIEVTKNPNGYLVHATPPHVKGEWRSPMAMTASAIIAELKKLGGHPTDIGDAFHAADPDWIA